MTWTWKGNPGWGSTGGLPHWGGGNGWGSTGSGDPWGVEHWGGGKGWDSTGSGDPWGGDHYGRGWGSTGFRPIKLERHLGQQVASDRMEPLVDWFGRLAGRDSTKPHEQPVLTKDWMAVMDSDTGCHYFWNTRHNHVQWELPHYNHQFQ